MMMRPRLSLAMIAGLLLSPPAMESLEAGTFYTGLATVLADEKPSQSSVIGNPDVQLILFKGDNSRAFTNTYGTDSQGRSLVRTVAITTLQMYKQTGPGNVSPVHYAGNDLVTSVSVLEGYVESTDLTNQTQTAFFTFGRVGLFTVAKGPDYDPLDPSTWGVVTTKVNGQELDPDTLKTAIATYVLKPPEDVRDGLVNGFPLLTDANGVPFTTNTVNRSSISLEPNGKADGNLLFKEETGTNFISVTDPVFPPSLVDAEGFFVQYRQGINSAQTGAVSEQDLRFLNFIAGNFGGLGNLGASGTAFATALNTGPGTFDAKTYSGTANNANNSNVFFGDFVASYDTIQSTRGDLRAVRPGVETLGVVPEPSSGILASIGLALTGLVAWRRKKIGNGK